MKRSILSAIILFVCGTTNAQNLNQSYIGIDAKLQAQNARTNGLPHKHHTLGIKPHLGFKLAEGVYLELAYELVSPKFLNKKSTGLNIRNEITTAMVMIESLISEKCAYAFLGFGPGHTKITTHEMSGNANVGSKQKVVKIKPVAQIGIRQELSDSASLRGYVDWKGTRNVKVKSNQCDDKAHSFKHSFGFGLGLSYAF